MRLLDLSGVSWKGITPYNSAMLRADTKLIEEHEAIHARHHNAILGHREFSGAVFTSTSSHPRFDKLTDRQAQTVWFSAMWRDSASRWYTALTETSELFHRYIDEDRHGFGRLQLLDPCPKLSIQLENPHTGREHTQETFVFSLRHFKRGALRLHLFDP
jgi:hypothetical protein